MNSKTQKIIHVVLALLGIGYGVYYLSRDVPKEVARPAATSSFSKQEIVQFASEWVNADPENRLLGKPMATGSMVPLMDSKCVLILERVTDKTILFESDICSYEKDDEKKVLHRIRKIEGDIITFRGDSNLKDDPYEIHRADVQWRVVGIFYTNGK